MNKKEIYHLIMFPGLCFLILSAGAWFFSHLYFGYYNNHEKENQISEQKFEQFIDNVKSGKWQLTTDKWIEGMKLQRSEAETEYQSVVPLIEFLQFIGWFSLILAGCNVLVVLCVKDKIKKRQNDLPCEGQKK
jgi:hypothetical protein